MRRYFFRAIIPLFLLSTIVTCMEGRKRPVRLASCPHDRDAEGNCIPPSSKVQPPPTRRVRCLNDYTLRYVVTGDCVFSTASQPSCEVPGLGPVAKQQVSGCYVRDFNGVNCELEDVDRNTSKCLSPMPKADANVSVYLEVKDNGLVPRIRFSGGGKVEAGAELTFKPKTYDLSKLASGMGVNKESDTHTSITLPLEIEWWLDYTVDSKETCATGILNGSHISTNVASPGKVCP